MFFVYFDVYGFLDCVQMINSTANTCIWFTRKQHTTMLAYSGPQALHKGKQLLEQQCNYPGIMSNLNDNTGLGFHYYF